MSARGRRTSKAGTRAAPAREPRPKEVTSIEIVEDRTKSVPCDEGFLRLKRFTVRNVYADGARSDPYPCDVVSRREPDAVAVALYTLGPAGSEGGHGNERDVLVVLRSGVRPPVHFRRDKALVQPDAVRRSMLLEVVAGMLEPEDRGADGVERRASVECREEAGAAVPASAIAGLGAESFPSPGVTDEKVHFRAAKTVAPLGSPAGDGSVMEEAGHVVMMPLAEAIEACRTGGIPDMKTEIALVRLAEHLGYVPQLGRFVDELPPDVRARWRPLGIPPARR